MEGGCCLGAAKLEYPAVFHFRVIAEASLFVAEKLDALLADYKIVEPPAQAANSNAGRYLSCAVSIEMQSQEQLHAFDEAVRGLPGVRMLL